MLFGAHTVDFPGSREWSWTVTIRHQPETHIEPHSIVPERPRAEHIAQNRSAAPGLSWVLQGPTPTVRLAAGLARCPTV